MEQNRVLVVDDEPQVLKLFGRLLVKAGYQVFMTDSGTDALNIIERQALDLVVLDLSMPEPDGFEMLKVIRSKWPSLKILMTSGLFGGGLLTAASHLGATATLIKTDAPTQLVEKVRKLLSAA